MAKKIISGKWGDTGPCGPCSEIHVDLKAMADENFDADSRASAVNADDPTLIEIWNLVFIQFNRQAGGQLLELPAKHVDTGMGLDRLVAVLQGKTSNYDTDLFQPIIQESEKITNRKYSSTDSMQDVAFRVIADHMRALCISFADGVLPGNSSRGYVTRRLLRRASRFGRQGLEMTKPFLYQLVPAVAKIFEDVFPEIAKRQEHITLLIQSEEKSFLEKLDRGIHLFQALADEVKGKKETVIPGDKAYQLYHQDGFPRDLVDLMAKEQGLEVDDEGWKKAEDEHRVRSQGEKANYEIPPEELSGLPATRFLGYGKMESNSHIVKLIDNDKLILDQTPFYAESGGQVGDKGLICSRNFKFVVRDTKKMGDIYIHFGELEKGDLSQLPEYVTAYVERERRRKIMANHTATHLLHWALREILGDHASQQGSLVSPDYFRFDVSHPKKITKEEIKEMEKNGQRSDF